MIKKSKATSVNLESLNNPYKTILMAQDKDQKTLNVPPLRFPGFTDDWKKTTLGECCTFYSGGTPTSGRSEYYGGEIPFIRSGEIHSDNTELSITEMGLKSSSAKMVSKGDLLLAMYGATSGEIDISKINGAINQAILCIQTTQERYFLKSLWIKHAPRILNTYLQGGQGNLSAEIIRGIKFSFPPILEQGKISRFISVLDQRIATQNKIIEDLKKLKSAIIDNIMDNSNYHRIRFEELYDKAGEGGTPSTSVSEYYTDGTIPFVKIEDLSKKYLFDSKDHITELGLCKSSAWIIPTNSIIYSNGATIGAISINKIPVCTKQGILGIIPKKEFDVEYLYYFMSSTYFRKQVERIVTEGTMRTAYLKDINHIECPVPDYEKQIGISQILRSFSNKIEIEQRLLTNYIQQKEYLLKSLFI